MLTYVACNAYRINSLIFLATRMLASSSVDPILSHLPEVRLFPRGISYQCWTMCSISFSMGRPCKTISASDHPVAILSSLLRKSFSKLSIFYLNCQYPNGSHNDPSLLTMRLTSLILLNPLLTLW